MKHLPAIFSLIFMATACIWAKVEPTDQWAIFILVAGAVLTQIAMDFYDEKPKPFINSSARLIALAGTAAVLYIKY